MAKLMNWYKFERQLKEKKLLLFSSRDICRLFGATKISIIFLLHRYSQRGLIVRVKRGLYVFPDSLPPELFIANKLYEPSYVSMDFALSYHRVISENVYEITSITSKTTRRFETLGKIYSYRHIKKVAYGGYAVEKQQGCSFAIAEAEKAFVDANYFRMLDGLDPISRFDKAKINLKKALHYAELFGQSRLIRIIKTTLQ